MCGNRGAGQGDQYELASEQTVLETGLTSQTAYTYGAGAQVTEKDVSGPGHAEETIMNSAQQNGQTVKSMGVSRDPCPGCARMLKDKGVDVQGPE